MDAARPSPFSATPDFDFDEWMLLARRDPAAFFQRRQRLIDNFIDAHPQQAANLRAMQSQIDAARAVAGTPDKALGVLMGMLGDQVSALGGQMQLLQDELQRLNHCVANEALQGACRD